MSLNHDNQTAQTSIHDKAPPQVQSDTRNPEKEDAVVTPAPLDEERNDEPEYPGRLRLFGIFIALSCGVFEVGLVENVVATAAPTITDYFHSSGDLGWYGSS